MHAPSRVQEASGRHSARHESELRATRCTTTLLEVREAESLSGNSSDSHPDGEETDVSHLAARRSMAWVCRRASELLPQAKGFAKITIDAFCERDAGNIGRIQVADFAQERRSAIDDQIGQCVTSAEFEVIAAEVQRFFEQVDVHRTGSIGIYEWIHHVLLETHPPGAAALAAINNGLVSKNLGRIVSLWLKADPEGVGLIPLELLSSPLKSRDGERVFHALSKRVGGDVRQALSYAEFCAQQVGLEPTPVELHYYDVSKRSARFLAPLLLGHLEDGLWHTGLVVFGKEYYFKGGVQVDDPGTSDFGKPTKVLRLGMTLRSRREMHAHLVHRIESLFRDDTYDVFTNNCNHFCDALALFLLGRHVPDEVRLLPDRLLQSVLAKMLRPALNRWLGGTSNGPASVPPVLAAHTADDVPGAFSHGDTLDEGGRPVLFADAGYTTPSVARVLRTHAGGTCDITWFDFSGQPKVAVNIKMRDLRPYAPKAGWPRETYEAVLAALSRSQRSQCRSDATAVRGAVSEVVAFPCIHGHDMRRNKATCFRVYVCSSSCSSCCKVLRWRAPRVVCRRCDHKKCEECWQTEVDATSASSSSLGFMAMRHASTLKCPKGHSLEQFSGQAVRSRATCNRCGREELGATSPIFHSCRLCEFDLCQPCATAKIASLTDCWQQPLETRTIAPAKLAD